MFALAVSSYKQLFLRFSSYFAPNCFDVIFSVKIYDIGGFLRIRAYHRQIVDGGCSRRRSDGGGTMEAPPGLRRHGRSATRLPLGRKREAPFGRRTLGRSRHEGNPSAARAQKQCRSDELQMRRAGWAEAKLCRRKFSRDPVRNLRLGFSGKPYKF